MDFKAIMEYFDEHPDSFAACVEELDDINQILGGDRYFPMHEIGHDEDEIVTEDGEKRFAPFNASRKYFYIGRSGKLISSDKRDYTDYLNDFTLAALRRNKEAISAIREDEELRNLFGR